MRILWITNTPSGYTTAKGGYNGGGWISSLESELAKNKQIQLGVCFVMDNQPSVVEKGTITYFPIANSTSKLRRWWNYFSSTNNRESYLLEQLQNVISLFKPDIIHIFGTEQPFGLLAKYTNIPVLIHVQGLLGPCLNAFLPPGQKLSDYLFSSLNPTLIFKKYLLYHDFFVKGAKREQEILKYCKHYIGRTEWDRNLIKLYSPQSIYNYCSEVLRPIFYISGQRSELPLKLTICSTISGIPFKGFDIILKCARLLKDQFNIDFEWNVFGNIDAREYEKKLSISCTDYNINLLGVVSADILVDYILRSTCFVHPSYIDNSPNSVCEAQILGCSVIAQDVGGVSSLVTHNETGFILPANDPYQMVIYIIKLYEDSSYNKQIGDNARRVASIRHDRKMIVDRLIDIYENMIQ